MPTPESFLAISTCFYVAFAACREPLLRLGFGVGALCSMVAFVQQAYWVAAAGSAYFVLTHAVCLYRMRVKKSQRGEVTQ